MKAIIDIDYVKYAAASAGEKRTIKVVHKKSGREKEYKTRTEFYGHWKKKDGGALAEINKSRTSPFLLDEFEIIDVQTPEPLANVLHTAKMMVEGVLKQTGASDYKAFMGQGDSFRVERSTLLKYKGHRTGLKALHLEAVSDYLVKKFNCEIVTGIESDDACVMAAYADQNSFIIGADKDFYSCDVSVYNVHHQDEGVVDCRGFGKLWLDEEGKVRGYGRKFLAWQVMAQDTSDNYAANCVSEKKWGDKAAFTLLSQKQTDKEVFEALVEGYKYLYPEPKVVTGWRGNEIEIDWKYVLHENWDLARMLRWEGDVVNPFDVMKKLGVNYD